MNLKEWTIIEIGESEPWFLRNQYVWVILETERVPKQLLVYRSYTFTRNSWFCSGEK